MHTTRKHSNDNVSYNVQVRIDLVCEFFDPTNVPLLVWKSPYYEYIDHHLLPICLHLQVRQSMLENIVDQIG